MSTQVLVLRVFDAIMVLGAVISLTVTSVHSATFCPTGIANFGDSLTDTGNALDAFPFFPGTDAENSPYGETFFGAPAKRFSNGRLVPDFFAQAFRQRLLDAYFSVASFDYTHGINLAEAGATAAALANPPVTPFSVTPFQTSQFARFMEEAISAQAQGLACINFNGVLPSSNVFSNWLYSITAGGNDLLLPIESGVPISYVNSTLVPQAVAGVVSAIHTLYNGGARQFLIYGIPAAGCSTVILTDLRSHNYTKDSFGCISDVNSVVQNFNVQLLAQIKTLRQALTGSSIAFFDYYAANFAILSNPTAFGFTPSLVFTACCGAPGNGTLNYNPAITCGHPSLGSNVCANPDRYLIWDGVHFTEAFYRYIAEFALNGVYTDGGINYAASCNLDFSKFASGITFQQAYPFQNCNNLFT